MGNAKDNLHAVLEAHVTASANTEENFVYLKDIIREMQALNVTFTTGKAQTPMTERQSKVCVSSARRAFEKCLANEGLSPDAIEKEVDALGLKKIKSPPKMTHQEGFNFASFRERLKERAKG
jgi:hypothetical protein